MLQRNHLLYTAVIGLPALLTGCGTVGTYYPKTTAVPAVTPVERLEKQKSLLAGRHPKPAPQAVAAEPVTDTPAQPQPPASPEPKSTVEILPVEFEPLPAFEDAQPDQQQTSYDGESSGVPLPEPEGEILPLPSSGMTLDELEALAMQNNPAIKELAASTQKAAGYRSQVDLKPNPTLGYQGQQLADQGTDQHIAYVEREFVTGCKLELNRRVLNATLSAQLQELQAQRLRVSTDIKIRFYQALALQRQLELIEEFSVVADKGLEIARLRKEAGEGSQVDVLQASIQRNEIGLAEQQAQAKLAATWREISAIAGVPNLPYAVLAGALPTQTPAQDWTQLSASLVSASPEYAAAHVRITRAHAALERQLEQPLPNVAVQLGAGVDNGTDSGMLNLQVGIPLPVNNNNHGNIAAARAEVSRSHMEAQRIQNDIQARLAVVSREYETAVAAVNQYATNILPSANASRELAEQAYEAGEAEFVQVLIARRTYFDTNLQYVTAQSELAIAQSKIDGFLLTGALNSVRDDSGDDSLRGQVFSQQ